MLVVFLFWIVLFCIFFALGDAFLYASLKVTGDKTQYSIINTFFIGLAIAAILACGLSLFTPLTKYIFLLILAFTVIYGVYRRKKMTKSIIEFVKELRSLSVWGKIVYTLIIIIVLYHSGAFSNAYDQFLYHQQHIKWLQEYGVVNGLANLHMRLGFNSSSLSITSLFAFHPDLKISFTALNGLSLFVFASWLTIKAQKSKETVASFAYLFTLVIFVQFYAVELSSTSTDVLVNIVATYLLLNCFFERECKGNYLQLAILPVFCVTLKLSSAPIIILSLFAFYQLFKNRQYRSLTFSLTTVTLLFGVWLAQNIILTGYLIFPFPEIDLFSFDWKVPSDIVAQEKIITYNWARGIETSSATPFGWISSWWSPIQPVHKIIYGLSILALLLSPLAIIKVKKEKMILLGCIVSIIGAIFGFLTAPALRFSLGFVVPVIFIPLLPLTLVGAKNIGRYVLIPLQYGLLTTLIAFHMWYISMATIDKSNSGLTYLRAQYIKPFPISYAGISAIFDTIIIKDVEIYVPQNGFSYDGKLPNTPYIKKGLEPRRTDIRDGFRIKE